MLAKSWMKRVGAGVCSCALFAAPIASTTMSATTAEAATPAAVKDIKLGPNGSLTGVVKDANGRAKAAEIVTVGFSGAEVATVQTLEDGRFTIEGLREGSHVVKTSGTQFPVRFWEGDKAPPTADSGITLVSRQVPADEGAVVQEFVPEQPPVQYNPAPSRGYAPRRGFLGRAFANYPILTTAALLGAGIGSGIAIGSSSDSTPATQ
jgi:hypothetical protein